jgi:pseudouridine-5'-phosphate glycosidase
MPSSALLSVDPKVAAALQANRPVVALESTLIAHGLPWPINLETALLAEDAVRAEGAVPATIAVWQGVPRIGLARGELEELAHGHDIMKASRRDLATAIAKGSTAATTVAATMYLAHRAGIRLFATGGIGGAHRGEAYAWDISADLIELARTAVAVVCAGAKSVLDIPRTLEILETAGVPVVGYRTDEFPAFYVRSSKEPVSARADTPEDAARLLKAHWQMGGAGVVLAQPIAVDAELNSAEFNVALGKAQSMADESRIRGKALTPFLLNNLADLTEKKTVRANQALVVANARLAAQIALHLGSRD